ncbi:hypothetical protein BJ165DRAFT_1526849 [Panaeolus papilionaceus]|nr:hypothetical protein BJ165DRAFT_1526849 [Panaeolus papilionaceus]
MDITPIIPKPSHRLIRAQRLMIASIILSLTIIGTDALLIFAGTRFSSLPVGLITIAQSATVLAISGKDANANRNRTPTLPTVPTLRKAFIVYTNWLIFSLWCVVFGLTTSKLVMSHRRDMQIHHTMSRAPWSEFIVLFAGIIIEMATTFCIALLCNMERKASEAGVLPVTPR